MVRHGLGGFFAPRLGDRYYQPPVGPLSLSPSGQDMTNQCQALGMIVPCPVPAAYVQNPGSPAPPPLPSGGYRSMLPGGLIAADGTITNYVGRSGGWFDYPGGGGGTVVTPQGGGGQVTVVPTPAATNLPPPPTSLSPWLPPPPAGVTALLPASVNDVIVSYPWLPYAAIGVVVLYMMKK